MMTSQEVRMVMPIELVRTGEAMGAPYVPYSHGDFSALFRAMERRDPQTYEQFIDPRGGFFSTRDMANVMNAVQSSELGPQLTSVDIVSEQLGMTPEQALRNLAKAREIEAWARTDDFASRILEARALRAQNRE